MATHETGTFDDHQQDEDDRLGTHHEDHEDHDEHQMTSTRSEEHEESQVESQPGENDGKKKGKKEVELQDQTNLLPVRQLIFVFIGLTCAIFCSLLDQTM